ncbi:MAG: phage tail protein [Anaerohalosphaeraceae bacterium]
MNFSRLIKRNTILFSLCLLISSLAGAFTYQGRLHDKGDPAQGKYDMFFTLYDAASGGNAVSATITLSQVEVTNGYFTVDLDFGTSAYLFNGQPRWLDIATKPYRSILVPETLSPRQKISPVPSATFANTAERLEPPAFISNYIIRMVIDGTVRGTFHYFNQLGPDTEVVEYLDGEERIPRKRPGSTHAPDVELKCFANQNSYLEAWFASVAAGTVDRRTVTFSIVNQDGYIVDRREMLHCWPCILRYDYEPRFDTVVMTLTLATEQVNQLEVPTIQKPFHWFPGPQPVIKGPFRLSFDSGEELVFNSFSQVGTKVEVVEYMNSEDRIPRKRPGRTITLDPTFDRPVQQNTFLKSWYQSVLDGATVRYSPSLSLNNSDGTTVIEGTLINCWPCKFEPHYDTVNKVLNETVKLACEKFTLN